MLKQKEFEKLTYNDKKSVLKEIFVQITTETTPFEDVQFLLQSSDRISEMTLINIYIDINKLIKDSKLKKQAKQQRENKHIYKKLQEKATKDSSNSEKLLNNLN